jgi:hypothetical protein
VGTEREQCGGGGYHGKERAAFHRNGNDVLTQARAESNFS